MVSKLSKTLIDTTIPGGWVGGRVGGSAGNKANLSLEIEIELSWVEAEFGNIFISSYLGSKTLSKKLHQIFLLP